MSTSRQDTTPASSAAPGDPPSKRSELAEIGIRLLDEAHAVWRRAELECEVALEAWFDATARIGGDRYRSYLAALDREEAAAGDLRRLWELAQSGHDALVRAAAQTSS